MLLLTLESHSYLAVMLKATLNLTRKCDGIQGTLGGFIYISETLISKLNYVLLITYENHMHRMWNSGDSLFITHRPEAFWPGHACSTLPLAKHLLCRDEQVFSIDSAQ